MSCLLFDFFPHVTLLAYFNRNIHTPAYSCGCPMSQSCGSSPVQVKSSVPAHFKWQNGGKCDLVTGLNDKLVQCRYVECWVNNTLYTLFVIETVSVVLRAAAAWAGQPRWITVISGPSGPPKQQQRWSALPVWEQLTTLSHLYLRHWQVQLSGVKQNPDHQFRTLQPWNTRPPSASTCVNISLFYGRPFSTHVWQPCWLALKWYFNTNMKKKTVQL